MLKNTSFSHLLVLATFELHLENHWKSLHQFNGTRIKVKIKVSAEYIEHTNVIVVHEVLV